jgi:hypothetical protein
MLPKPLASKILMMVLCSILSKAFSKSSFRMIISFWSGGKGEGTQRTKLSSLGWFSF